MAIYVGSRSAELRFYLAVQGISNYRSHFRCFAGLSSNRSCEPAESLGSNLRCFHLFLGLRHFFDICLHSRIRLLDIIVFLDPILNLIHERTHNLSNCWLQVPCNKPRDYLCHTEILCHKNCRCNFVPGCNCPLKKSCTRSSF